MEVWVFDIDETTLSNLPYYAKHGFGKHGDFICWANSYSCKRDQPPCPLLKMVTVILQCMDVLTAMSTVHMEINRHGMLAGDQEASDTLCYNEVDGISPSKDEFLNAMEPKLNSAII
ncbi:Stem 28 kDa glycoprotein [Hordeum vulgare]|nr:Stem 28 kDa glycoprotein [Hordeum vulgare]